MNRRFGLLYRQPAAPLLYWAIATAPGAAATGGPNPSAGKDRRRRCCAHVCGRFGHG